MTGTRRKSRGEDSDACDDFLQDFGVRVREARLRRPVSRPELILEPRGAAEPPVAPFRTQTHVA